MKKISLLDKWSLSEKAELCLEIGYVYSLSQSLHAHLQSLITTPYCISNNIYCEWNGDDVIHGLKDSMLFDSILAVIVDFVRLRELDIVVTLNWIILSLFLKINWCTCIEKICWCKFLVKNWEVQWFRVVWLLSAHH